MALDIYVYAMLAFGIVFMGIPAVDLLILAIRDEIRENRQKRGEPKDKGKSGGKKEK